MAVLWITHPSSAGHLTGPGHPERPDRLVAAAQGIERHGLRDLLVEIESVPASAEAVARVHDDVVMRTLEALDAAGGGSIDADTPVGAASLEAARYAAGAGLTAVSALDAGRGTAAFCAIRPPGHHATRSSSMGFCLINNVAVTARALVDRGERVLIADFDAHHGNGTQDVFYDDPDVLFVSWHQWPLYPGTGRVEEAGVGAGVGTTINLPVPPGATGDRYRAGFERVVVPAVEAFAPTWLLISAGFDAHRRDPLCDLGLTSADYGDLVTDLMATVAPGRTIAFLEGGYALEAVSMSTAATVAALGGEQVRPEAPTSGGPGAPNIDAAVEARRRLDR